MGNWEAAARRTILGKKTFIQSLAEEGKESEFWIKPKKYSIEDREEIKKTSGDLLDKLPDDIVEIIVKKQKENNGNNSDEDSSSQSDFLDAFAELDMGQRRTVLKVVQESKGTNVLSLILKKGIGEHNFEDEKGSDNVPEEFVQKILEYAPVADELVKIIQEHNSPLAGKNSGK